MAVPRKNQLLIRAAVMNCLARCSESSAPLATLGGFLEQLSKLGWHPEEVFAVERAVLAMLGRLQEQRLATTDAGRTQHEEGTSSSSNTFKSA